MSWGSLGPEVSYAHGVWLTEPNLRLLADHGGTVCHNASSNLRLKNGIAPVNQMLQHGVNVAMGTDSDGINDDDDMVQEMRLGLQAAPSTGHRCALPDIRPSDEDGHS